MSLMDKFKEFNEKNLAEERAQQAQMEKEQEKAAAERETKQAQLAKEQETAATAAASKPQEPSRNEAENFHQAFDSSKEPVTQVSLTNKEFLPIANFVVLSLILLILFCTLVVDNPTEGTGKWEYKITAPSDYGFDDEMAYLGSQGWELVFARRASGSGDKMSYEMIFKRPKK